LPDTVTLRITRGGAGAATGSVVAGWVVAGWPVVWAGCAPVGPGCAPACAKAGAARPPNMVPTSNAAQNLLPLGNTSVAVTRPRLLM
jgi:hypothetical protein